MKAISKMILITLGIGILAIAGGCAQEGLPAGMSPEDVITKALLNQTEYTQAVFEMKADANLKGEVEGEKNSLDGNFSLNGSSNSETGEMSVVMTVDADMNGEKLKANLELRSTADGVFVKIENVDLSDPDSQELVDLYLEDYLDKWVKLSFMTSQDLIDSGFMQVDYKENDPLPFKNIEYKGTTDILGLKSYHFTAEIDEQLVLDLMQGTETADAEKFFAAADIKGDVYVAVNEMVLTGFGGAMTLNDPEMNGTINMSFKVNPTKSAKVTTPESEKEFTEEDMMGLMFGGAMMSDPSMMEFDETSLDDSMMSDEDFEAMMEELNTGEMMTDDTAIVE
jgi:hypothetical protein